MEEVKDYKNEIANTRVGCLGSSDGKMLSQIAALGTIPKSAYKRLAVVKGLIPQVEIPKNAAIQAGDDLEMIVYSHLKAQDPRYESNPLWVSEKYSTKNCKLISHPDLVLQDEASKVLNVYEVKTTKYTFEQTRQTYEYQLFIHNLLAKEHAKKLGSDWKVKVFLVHYSTDGLDLENGIEFDPSRLTVHQVYFSTMYFDVMRGMNIVNTFLENFTEFYEQEEVDANLLPANVQTQFSEVAQFLREIKEREAKVDAFKAKLYDFLSERGIKKVSCDDFSFAVVAPTQQISVDYKALFTQEIEAKKPRVAKKLKEKYKKTTNKKGYVLIHVNNDDKS